MDYRLKALYEQMFVKQNTENSPSESPRPNTLAAAYKLVTERTAFYAKDLAAGEDIPNIQGLENLGAVEEPQKIKHTISSLSVLPALEKAMSIAGWSAIKGVDIDRSAKDFIVAGVSGTDLEKINSNKQKLTGFFQSVQKPEVFNMIDVIASDIKSKIEVDASPESLGLIFKRLFDEEGTIGGTAVGKGELAISLFTNSTKGKTGDLLSSGKTIEVKGKGGRLGPAEYSQANAARDLVQFLKAKKQNKKINLNRALVRLKTLIRKFALELETIEMYSSIFTDKLKQTLNQIADNVDDPNVFSFIEKAGFVKKYPLRSDDMVWDDFDKLGYLKPKQQDIPAAPMEKSITAKVQKAIKDFLFNSKDGIFKKGRLEQITGKSVELESLEGQSFTVAVQNFFLNDIGLTPEEAAEAFLSIKSYNKDVSKHLPEIKEFFQQHYSKMIEGDATYLQAAVFAFQLALYAQAGEEGQHFNYFMIMNPSSMNALSLDVERENLFTYLANTFLNNSDKIELSIRADGRQGASAVTLK